MPLAGCRAGREDGGTQVRAKNVVMSVARLNVVPSSHRSSLTESSSDRGRDGTGARCCAARGDRGLDGGRRKDGDWGPSASASDGVPSVVRLDPGQQGDDYPSSAHPASG